ncbi:MAG: glycine cleavage system protein GcvH [Bacteroidales bacterium]|nr:glycine cleavage system protein GcvH [Bacteroidales bacterium]
MKTPENVLYSKTHEWLRMEGDVAYVGITDFAQSELGDIVFLEIETVGETLAKDEVFGTIEAVKTVSDLLMPVSGTVLEVNPTLEENPALVNTNPYDEGWLVKIQVTDVNETKELLTADQYQEII